MIQIYYCYKYMYNFLIEHAVHQTIFHITDMQRFCNVACIRSYSFSTTLYISTSHLLKAVPLVIVNMTSIGLCSNPVIKETLRTTLAAFSFTWYESGVNPIVMSQEGERRDGEGRDGEGRDGEGRDGEGGWGRKGE